MDENEAKEMDVVKCVLPWSWFLVLGLQHKATPRKFLQRPPWHITWPQLPKNSR